MISATGTSQKWSDSPINILISAYRTEQCLGHTFTAMQISLMLNMYSREKNSI